MRKAVLLLVVVAAGGWLAWHRQGHRPNSTRIVATPQTAPARPVEVAPTVQEIAVQPKPAAPVKNNPAIPGGTATMTPGAGNAARSASGEEVAELLRELRAMAATNTEAALAAVMELPEGDERNQALAAVCFGLAQSDPADAVKLAQSLHLDQMPGAVMENLMQQWASSDATSAMTWADDQPAGSERDALMTRIGFVLSQSDPADAANLVMNQISPGSAQDEAVMAVLHQWGMQNMTGAANWVATFPDTPLRERALAELEGIQSYQ